MTLDVPYYTGLLIVGGFIVVPLISIVCKAIVELNKQDKKK